MAESILNSNKNNKSKNKSKIIAGAIFGYFVIAMIAGIAFSISSGKNEYSDTDSSADAEQLLEDTSPQTNSDARHESNGDSLQHESSNNGAGDITKEDVEDMCNETALLRTQGRGVNVINILNLDERFGKWGMYDKDGNPYYLYSWNGKYDNGEIANFNCYLIAPDKQNIKIIELSVGGTHLQGDIFVNGVYNSAGEKQE